MSAPDQKSSGPVADPRWAWAPYRPDPQRPWNLARAGHLYRRAGFGADWATLQRALADGPEKAVDRLVQPPAEAAEFDARFDELEAAGAGGNSAGGLRAWWLRRMIETPHPLKEKMTLFWHGYFAASNAKVQSARLIYDHLALLRGQALGRFDALIDGVSRDPAMLVCHDAQSNRKSQPTRHYARALFEQFTMGPGNFSDEDVEEASRALTGWFVLRGRLRYFEREHDPGPKRVLGHEGKFGVEDVVKIALGQPATPRQLVRKLYRWLISEVDEPTDKIVDPLAESLAADYDIARLVRRMLGSNLFFSDAAYRRRVKSPVEFAVGIARGLEGLVPTERLGAALADLGQNLYNPPTTSGWPGSRHWLNRATLIGRARLAASLLDEGGPYAGRLDPAAVAARHQPGGPQSTTQMLIDLFLDGELPEPVRAGLLDSAAASSGQGKAARGRRAALAVVTLPEFQLA